MKTRLWLPFAVTIIASVRLFGQPAVSSSPARTPDQLDELISPIALYPDPLVGVILPASTDWPDVQTADQLLRSNAGPETIDAQPWDESVKALTQYPQVVSWMVDNLPWTQEVGAAFIEQPTDVMNSIQRLRASARASGILVDSPQQRVIVQGSYVSIEPAQSNIVYVPIYDPEIVYVPRGRPVHRGLITFGVGFAVGARPLYALDWNRRAIWVDRNRRDVARTPVPPVVTRTEREEWHPRREAIARFRAAPRVNAEVVRPGAFHGGSAEANRVPPRAAPLPHEERLTPTGRVLEERQREERQRENTARPREVAPVNPAPAPPTEVVPHPAEPRARPGEIRRDRENVQRVPVPAPAPAPGVVPAPEAMRPHENRTALPPGESRAAEKRRENAPPEAKGKNEPRRPEPEPRKDNKDHPDDDRSRERES